MSLTCLAIAGSNGNAEVKVATNINSLQSSEKIPNFADKLASVTGDKINSYNTAKSLRFGENNNSVLPESSISDLSKDIAIQELSKDNHKSRKISTQLGYQRNSNYMTLTPTGKANSLGNPLYELDLFANGQLIGKYISVSGRAYTQTRDRNRSGTEAPLPDGKYKVATATTRGSIPEAGDRFLPIQPLFSTGRSSLGIHYDPSFDKNNGEDGTSGCVALTNRQDLSQVLEYVYAYRPQFLEVIIR
ncbi:MULTISPECIES: L,D-transpeptidase [unclassified Nostoc]|uniref:L,D-transpeptidase n=1 Tax=unclassified Nostoc TaxID=2593658 RepID=UPI0026069ECD|nr:L,D-transpeptidase [Nostoc sp. S13]MDF5736722.1 L,D-transpeptidase [Nostoc sp. S13]